ncbi:MAG: NADH-quinone oxidoreductase subunit J [Wolbachia endosymbiont of Fragariocoptes setiger]|nr:NADH-quinone oxidoreductase subunit J [Wolbachia endosymbiont of Fragariocoptes setiger]
MSFFFFLFSIFMTLSATCVISAKNPIHSVLFLIVTFIFSSLLFILLGAEFIAMMILIVYTGAVAVLFLFIVMMLDLKQNFPKNYILGIVLFILFFFIMGFVVYNSTTGINNTINYSVSNVKAIGNILYTEYMYAFHLSGILLLVAIIGAIILSLEKQKEESKKQNVLNQLMKSSTVKLIKSKFGEGVKWK